ncbi:MAG: glycosyltransferase family 4 protein, partial [Limisphaerales bacterium]
SPSDGERVAGRRVRGGPPPQYWELWREECELADRIVVNSEWSRECLSRAGVSREKVRVIPLAYEPAAASQALQPDFPVRFDATRPLRLLFVGQVTYLKGIIPLLEAMRELATQPVELTILGTVGCDVPAPLRSLPSVRWAGAVPRGQVGEFYRAANALVFPSFCDGFGLVQLEAQAHGLPVIASRHCGAVVADGVNGLLLPEVSATAISSAVRRCIEEPGLLTRLAANSRVEERFSLRSVGDQLLSVF